MSLPQNSIYSGHVWHKRMSPREHAFKYRVFYILQNLDDFDTKTKTPWCLSLNEFNLLSLREKDYGAGTRHGLKSHIISELKSAGVQAVPEKIFMLTMPRILGYGFNPITLFFCYDTQDQVTAIIYEVHNTFGETHSYLFTLDPGKSIEDHGINKSLYVSPFFDVSGKYRFHVNPPEESLELLIHYLDEAGKLRMTANLKTTRKPLTSGWLIRLFFAMPLVTLKVISGIHFEALRLWLKRMVLIPRPSPPKAPYSISNAGSNVSKDYE